MATASTLTDKGDPTAEPQAAPRSDSATPRLDRAVLLLALLVGAVLRLVGLTRQGFWTDELYLVSEARRPPDVLFNPQLHIHHPPGYRFAMHLWMSVSLEEWWLRLLPALSGLALIAAAWALARALWPRHRWASSSAAVLVATSPFLFHYSQDVTTYSWTALWVTVSFLLLARAWQTNSPILWAAWSLSLAVSVYSHYFAIFPFAAAFLGLVVAGLARGAECRRRLARALLAVLGAVALFAPWVWVLLSRGGRALQIYLFPITIDTQPLGWVPMLLVGYARSTFWTAGLGFWLLWALLLSALAWGAWTLWRSRATDHAAAVVLLALWGAGAVIGPYLFLRLTTPPTAVDPVRFAALAAPPLLVGLAAAIASLPRTALRLGAISAWLVLCAVQWRAEVTSPPAQDWRGIMQVVSSQAHPGDTMLAFPAFHAGAAASYYSIPVEVQGGWFVSEGNTPGAAAFWFPPEWRWQGFLDTDAYRTTGFDAEIAARTRNASRLWYLAGDGIDGTYPPSHAAEAALERAGWSPAEEWRRSPLVLRLYEKPDP